MSSKEEQIISKVEKGKPIRQVAAVPFRLDNSGSAEVLLITSRKTGRFIVPKGWPMKGKSGRKAAVTEAREEAGVTGKALKEPLGAYSYWKRLSNRFVNVTVTVYLLEVVDTLPDWKEGAQRKRAWLSPADAAMLIDEPQLASLLRSMIVPS
ncbi:NUDIX domain-containing protein [Mesorhizobium waimense]|uniref:NUDIX domain-containing protein n=1 Tax=Mesorhizobium waimense TaxID=1300307 RepID=A0A3A5KVU4_9HYPH|nr:NUDIX hydrolase [Mesorhizobium waimense]RJT40682.1 NUDIX domain-containing protein [Mesorhizobium waimense]